MTELTHQWSLMRCDSAVDFHRGLAPVAHDTPASPPHCQGMKILRAKGNNITWNVFGKFLVRFGRLDPPSAVEGLFNWNGFRNVINIKVVRLNGFIVSSYCFWNDDIAFKTTKYFSLPQNKELQIKLEGMWCFVLIEHLVHFVNEVLLWVRDIYPKSALHDNITAVAQVMTTNWRVAVKYRRLPVAGRPVAATDASRSRVYSHSPTNV